MTMLTAEQYIEQIYGTRNLARTVFLQDVPSLLTVIQDYGDYVRKQESLMLNFIMDIDAMTTTEFCKAHNIDTTCWQGDVQLAVNDMFRVDGVKNRLITEKAKELYRKKS